MTAKSPLLRPSSWLAFALGFGAVLAVPAVRAEDEKNPPAPAPAPAPTPTPAPGEPKKVEYPPPQRDGLRVGREQMWPAATEEEWKKPVLLTWQRTWEDAVVRVELEGLDEEWARMSGATS